MSRAGAIKVDAKPHVIRDRGAAAVIDGDAAMGMHAGGMATSLAIEKATNAELGMAMVLVRNSNHWGASGYYARLCADAGLIGVAVSNSPPVMAPTGGRSNTIGNEPTAYAIPGPDADTTLMFDIALSATAQTRVRMAADMGTTIPEGWILDSEGHPSTNPADIEHGTLLPAAGYKGYGLAVLMEVLSAVLSGAGMLAGCNYGAFRKGGPAHPSNTGHTVLAFDVEAFMPRDEFNERLATLRLAISESPKAPGVDRIYLPGDLEREHEREVNDRGLELDSLTWAALNEAAELVGLSESLPSIRLSA
jgi:LDH2 family malate/lactate/ureidoglycolate dehydrogenase